MILLSRVLQALTADGQHALPVSDLAKLASVLTTVGQSSSKNAAEKDGEPKGSEPATEQVSVAQGVRQVYNLDWPPVNRFETQPLGGEFASRPCSGP